MATDESLHEDEEEILVYVEFDGLISDNAFGSEQLRLDMIGIDTDHPIMQINGRFYEGTYEDAVGTYMFFEKTEEDPDVDPVFDIPSNLKYVDKTRKVLKMHRVFIENRAEVLGDSKHHQCMPNLDVICEAGVPVQHQEEALLFWNKLRDYRMDVLSSYLEKQKLRGERKSKGISIDSESEEEHPFAVYRNNAENEVSIETEIENTDLKSGEANVECQNKETGNPVNTSTNEESKEENIEKESKNKDDTSVNPEATTSFATESNSPKKEKASRKKLPTLKTKKLKVVHTVAKRKLKKSQVFKDKERITKDTKNVEDIKQSNVEDVHEEKLRNKELGDKVENKEPEDSNVSKKDLEMEVDKPSTSTDKGEKELKREAKVQEILKRLKLLAGEQVTQK